MRVLDDVDDLTAQLITELQLADLKTLSTAAEDLDDSHQAQDVKLACQIYEIDLKQDAAIRHFEKEETALAEASAAAVSDPAQALPESQPAPEGHVMLFDCVACGDRYDAEHCCPVPCQHHYCDDCLHDLFRSAMTDESLYPPRCCRRPIPYDDIRDFLRPELRAVFEAKREELDDNDRIYCRIPTCSTYISHSHREGNTGKCPTCNTGVCLACKNVAHDGDCPPDPATQQLLDLAQQEGWRRCPGCSRMIELNTGCYHMTQVATSILYVASSGC